MNNAESLVRGFKFSEPISQFSNPISQFSDIPLQNVQQGTQPILHKFPEGFGEKESAVGALMKILSGLPSKMFLPMMFNASNPQPLTNPVNKNSMI